VAAFVEDDIAGRAAKRDHLAEGCAGLGAEPRRQYRAQQGAQTHPG
jgi:hypothetical protein